MNKDIHQNPDRWPVPLGQGLLIELDIKRTESSLLVPDDGLKSTNVGTVRVVSSQLSDTYKEKFLPEGKGSLGQRVVVSEGALIYLSDHGKNIYEELGFTKPDAKENDYGQLAMVDMRRVVGLVHDEESDESPPFEPWGSLIFLEFEYDDESVDVVGLKSGKTYGPDDDPATELVVPESSRAAEENIATVTKVGPGVEAVEPGMDVIPRVNLESITYQGEDYLFVSGTQGLHAIV